MSQNLTPLARERITQYFSVLSESFGVPLPDLANLFSVTEPVETSFRDALLEATDFLNLITCVDVDQVKGQVVQTGIGGLYTGRVKGGRFKRKLGVDGDSYELVSVDSCASLDWATLCTWANAGSDGEFVRRMNDFVTKSFGLDMLRIGWNGIEAADDTDPAANPLGEDINKGWYQLAREWNSGSQIVAADAGDKIYFDPEGAGDVATLDAMASDLINATIHPAHRTDTSLVVLVGAELMAAAQHQLYSEATKPSEQKAAQDMAKSVAGRRAYVPPFFPARGMVVTRLDNLHIYTQRGTRQRSAKNNQDTLSFDNQYWRMEGYAIPDYEAFAGYEPADIEIGPRPEPPAAPAAEA
jgi:P2 family phage major capsid protein